MKLKVLSDVCIGCGMCVGCCSQCFAFNDDGKAQVITDPIPEDCEADAQNAKDSCPVAAIVDAD